MAKLKVNEEYKEIVALFNRLTGSHSLWEVFCDCIESYALAIQNTCCLGKQFEQNEKRYLEIMNRYNLDQRLIISQIFGEITNLLEKKSFSRFTRRFIYEIKFR